MPIISSCSLINYIHRNVFHPIPHIQLPCCRIRPTAFRDIFPHARFAFIQQWPRKWHKKITKPQSIAQTIILAVSRLYFYYRQYPTKINRFGSRSRLCVNAQGAPGNINVQRPMDAVISTIYGGHTHRCKRHELAIIKLYSRHSWYVYNMYFEYFPKRAFRLIRVAYSVDCWIKCDAKKGINLCDELGK